MHARLTPTRRVSVSLCRGRVSRLRGAPRDLSLRALRVREVGVARHVAVGDTDGVHVIGNLVVFPRGASRSRRQQRVCLTFRKLKSSRTHRETTGGCCDWLSAKVCRTVSARYGGAIVARQAKVARVLPNDFGRRKTLLWGASVVGEPLPRATHRR